MTITARSTVLPAASWRERVAEAPTYAARSSAGARSPARGRRTSRSERRPCPAPRSSAASARRRRCGCASTSVHLTPAPTRRAGRRSRATCSLRESSTRCSGSRSGASSPRCARRRTASRTRTTRISCARRGRRSGSSTPCGACAPLASSSRSPDPLREAAALRLRYPVAVIAGARGESEPAGDEGRHAAPPRAPRGDRRALMTFGGPLREYQVLIAIVTRAMAAKTAAAAPNWMHRRPASLRCSGVPAAGTMALDSQ